ncbi:hypothetical protein OAK16_03980 [Verrucomicrobia bacterium]|nr:hypothetical protein [Verrucomicrobiota bacterium]
MNKKTKTKLFGGPNIETMIKGIEHIDSRMTEVHAAGIKYTQITNSDLINDEQKGLVNVLINYLAKLNVALFECKQEMAFYGSSDRFKSLVKKSHNRNKDVDDALLDLWNAVKR